MCHNVNIAHFFHGIHFIPFPGLTTDENHISPIENLDNTISRLYSYLSGSEGDGEADQQFSPLRGTGNKHPRERSKRHGSRSPRRVSYPSVSSGSRSSSPLSNGCVDSDPELDIQLDRQVERHNRTMDTLGSSETGENVYSRINDTGRHGKYHNKIFSPPRLMHNFSQVYCVFMKCGSMYIV